jgi:hypothetical protein
VNPCIESELFFFLPYSGQNPGLSVLSFPYSFGGIPWGMYPAAAAAAAAAGLLQPNGQGGLPQVANGPSGATTPGATTNGNRRPGSPTTNGGGPPTPGPSDLANGGQGGQPYPVFPAAYIDPSNGAFLRMGGGVPPVRLMQPGPMLYNNQGLAAAAAAVVAAGGNPNGFNSLNLAQQNSLGYGGGASSNLSSLGSPSIGSLSGT